MRKRMSVTKFRVYQCGGAVARGRSSSSAAPRRCFAAARAELVAAVRASTATHMGEAGGGTGMPTSGRVVKTTVGTALWGILLEGGGWGGGLWKAGVQNP